MSLQPLRELMKELVQLHIVTEDQVRECTRNLPRDENMIANSLVALADKQYLTPYQVERIKLLDFQSLVLGGNKLLYENAAGSFARVFRGAKLSNNQMIAIKVLRSRWSEDEDTVTLFKREAEVGKKLKHPNIVPIYDIGYENDQHYFTMEFVEGGNLRDFIKIRVKLHPAEALRYVIDISRGLEYAISLGYTHRDMKPTNVLLSSQGVAKLIDFGLAATEETMKKVGGEAFVNALEYNTLEKGTNSPRNDPRSDLFFLGVIFYELIAGVPAYESTSDRQERKRLSRYTDIKPLIEVAPDCPKMIAAIVDRLLQSNPANRYQSATELLRDLKMAQGKIGEAEKFVPAHKSKESGLQSSSPASATVINRVDIMETLFGEDSDVRELNKSGIKKTSSDEICAKTSHEPTVMFLETRSKEQSIIKDYFRKYGFKVLMITDASRLNTRLKEDPPECVVVMGEILSNEIWKYVPVLKKSAAEARCPIFIIAGKNQKDDRFVAEKQQTYSLQYQPVTLRDMRAELSRLLNCKYGTSPARESKSGEIDSDEIDISRL